MTSVNGTTIKNKESKLFNNEKNKKIKINNLKKQKKNAHLGNQEWGFVAIIQKKNKKKIRIQKI